MVHSGGNNFVSGETRALGPPSDALARHSGWDFAGVKFQLVCIALENEDQVTPFFLPLPLPPGL